VLALGACALDFPLPPEDEPFAVNTALAGSAAIPTQGSTDSRSVDSGLSAMSPNGSGGSPSPAAPVRIEPLPVGANPAAAGAPAPQLMPGASDAPASPMSAKSPDLDSAASAPSMMGSSEPIPSAIDTSTGSAEDEPFELRPVDFVQSGSGLALPLQCRPPLNISPGFAWSGVPPGTLSLALVYRDLELGFVRWVVWDIPTSITSLPQGISSLARPTEVPGSSQIGLGGSSNYIGPVTPQGRSEFTLWALNVAKLPDATWLSATELAEELLPAHRLATAPAVVVTNAP
jgi:Raf kinase inhibitor-like YbhB/YbcL family protein